MAGAGGRSSTTNVSTARATRTACAPPRLTPLSRLLAVCDVYAAFCTARPHRPAKETRTALTDVLLMAESGLLDRDYAERLLELTFYPVGAAVEMADGSLALVAAAPSARATT